MTAQAAPSLHSLTARAPPPLPAGGLSRTLAAVAACPITLVKTRMEYGGAGGHAYRGTLHALGEIWRTEGLRGMYRGIGPTALSQAPFSALYYMFYTQLQARQAPGCLTNRVLLRGRRRLPTGRGLGSSGGVYAVDSGRACPFCSPPFGAA